MLLSCALFPFPSSAWLKLRLMTSSVSFFIFLRNPSSLAPQTPHLNGLHEREEERPDADAAAEQLDEPGGAEEAEEADVDDLRGVHDAPHHRDEVERVPRVLEVRLREERTEKWVWNYLVDNPVADHNREGEMQEINSSVLALSTNVGKFLLQV